MTNLTNRLDEEFFEMINFRYLVMRNDIGEIRLLSVSIYSSVFGMIIRIIGMGRFSLGGPSL